MSKQLVDIGTQTTAQLIENKIGHAVGINPIPKEELFTGGHNYSVGAITGGENSTIAINFKKELYVLTNDTKKFFKMTKDHTCWDDEALIAPHPINIHETCVLVYDNPVTEKKEIHILGGYGYNSRAHYKWDGKNWSVASELPYDFCGGKAIVFNDEIHIFGGGENHYSLSTDGYLNYHYKWDGSDWKEASKPSFNMKGATPVVFNNEIWLIGSVTSSDNRKVRSFSNGSWTNKTSIPTNYYGVTNASVIVFNETIHVVGGVDTSGNKLQWHITYTESSGWDSSTQIPSEALCDSSNGLVEFDNNLWIIGSYAFFLNSKGKWIAYQDLNYSVSTGIVVSIDAVNDQKLAFFYNDMILDIDELRDIDIDDTLQSELMPGDIVIKSKEGDIHIITNTGTEIKHYCYIKTIDGEKAVYILSPEINSLPLYLLDMSAAFYKGKLNVIGNCDSSYNHFVLEDGEWKQISTVPFEVSNSKIVAVNDHLYVFNMEPSDDSTIINMAEFDGLSWTISKNVDTLDTYVESLTLLSFQNKLHAIFIDKDQFIRHIVYSGSKFYEYNKITRKSYRYVTAVVNNNSIHIFGTTDWIDSNHYVTNYSVSDKNSIQVYLSKGHQIVCNKNELIPIYGKVEEASNGYIATDSGEYCFLVVSDDTPYYSIT